LCNRIAVTAERQCYLAISRGLGRVVPPRLFLFREPG
jgi:hypothetical protein